MPVVRYSGTVKTLGTRSTPAQLEQRHSVETYTCTKSKMYEGCTNHGLYYLTFLN